MQKRLIVLALVFMLPTGAVLAQSARPTGQGNAAAGAHASAQAGAQPEARTVPGVVTSVQVDRFLMSGHRENDAVTYNVLVGSATRIVSGSTTMQLADLRPGTNVEVQGQLTMLTLTMKADRVVVGGPAAAASTSAASGQPAASAVPEGQAKGSGIRGFFASLMHALFGWLHR